VARAAVPGTEPMSFAGQGSGDSDKKAGSAQSGEYLSVVQPAPGAADPDSKPASNVQESSDIDCAWDGIGRVLETAGDLFVKNKSKRHQPADTNAIAGQEPRSGLSSPLSGSGLLTGHASESVPENAAQDLARWLLGNIGISSASRDAGPEAALSQRTSHAHAQALHVAPSEKHGPQQSAVKRAADASVLAHYIKGSEADPIHIPTAKPTGTHKAGSLNVVWLMPNANSQSDLSLAEASEAGLAGEFFSYDASAAAIASVEDFQDAEEVLDERHVRSMSPEVTARRARYQVLVFRLIVAMVVLILAAAALRLIKH
jgi:hypothetical protein